MMFMRVLTAAFCFFAAMAMTALFAKILQGLGFAFWVQALTAFAPPVFAAWFGWKIGKDFA